MTGSCEIIPQKLLTLIYSKTELMKVLAKPNTNHLCWILLLRFYSCHGYAQVLCVILFLKSYFINLEDTVGVNYCLRDMHSHCEVS